MIRQIIRTWRKAREIHERSKGGHVKACCAGCGDITTGNGDRAWSWAANGWLCGPCALVRGEL